MNYTCTKMVTLCRLIKYKDGNHNDCTCVYVGQSIICISSLCADEFLGTTPARRPESPEYSAKGEEERFSPNMVSLHDEQATQESYIEEA